MLSKTREGVQLCCTYSWRNRDVAKIGSHDVKLWQCHKIATFKHIHEHQNLSYPSIKRRCGCTCLPFGVCRLGPGQKLTKTCKHELQAFLQVPSQHPCHWPVLQSLNVFVLMLELVLKSSMPCSYETSRGARATSQSIIGRVTNSVLP